MRDPLLPIALAVSLCVGCSDILEEDLEGMGVVLLTPPAGHTSATNQISFRWEAVPNADRYRLQVCTPDFSAPVSFALDSTLSNTVFDLLLSPGSYSWRVRAETENSHTDWYTRSFSITSSENLSGQVPLLLSPPNGTVLDTNEVTCLWDTLPFTVDHRFELREDSQTGDLVQVSITALPSITLIDLSDGRYAWGVQAQNAVPSSSDFAYRVFTVDRTAPSAPVQTFPTAEAHVPQAPFMFTWQSGQDATSTTTDSLVVRNAQLQVIRAIGGSNGAYADSLGPGTYTWIVRTLDAAGNSATAGPLSFSVP